MLQLIPLYLGLLFLLLLSFTGCGVNLPGPGTGGSSNRGWMFLVYLDGAGNPEQPVPGFGAPVRYQ